MIEAKLQIDKFGFNMPNATGLAPGYDEKPLFDKLIILVNDVAIAMQRLEYASYSGKVYKKDPRTRYTYSYNCVTTLASNEQFKSRLIRDMRKVIELIIRTLTANYSSLWSSITIWSKSTMVYVVRLKAAPLWRAPLKSTNRKSISQGILPVWSWQIRRT